MYNRYIPQPDGSYRRNRIPVNEPEPIVVRETRQQEQSTPSEPISRNQNSAGSFLRQLIPKGLDTGDLLIIVLLLLMAGECDEDKNTALLTLALYLFM